MPSVIKDFQKINRLCDLLKSYPLYKDGHWVGVVQTERGYSASYWPSHSRSQNKGGTGFDIEIRGQTGDVLDISIKLPWKRQGHGKRLYQIIEEFCKEQGCTEIQTMPSGEGQAFWPALGFNIPCKVGLKKKIA